MASCFKNPNKKNLSAKDYVLKKKRSAIFCNVRNNMLDKLANDNFTPTGSNIACVNGDGIFVKYNNNETQLDMLRAYEDFRTDLLKAVQGQLFKNNFCAPYYINEDNTNIRNGYFNNNVQLAFGDGEGDLDGAGTMGTYGQLTTHYGALNQDIISVHPDGKNEYRNTYAEIKGIDPDLEEDLQTFKNNKFFLFKPPICDNKTRPQVLQSGDLAAPILSSVTILIE